MTEVIGIKSPNIYVKNERLRANIQPCRVKTEISWLDAARFKHLLAINKLTTDIQLTNRQSRWFVWIIN